MLRVVLVVYLGLIASVYAQNVQQQAATESAINEVTTKESDTNEVAARIGIFGGSFNPIHNGHLDVLKYAQHQLQLNLVYLVPAFQNPLKAQSSQASVEKRLSAELVDNSLQLQSNRAPAEEHLNTRQVKNSLTLQSDRVPVMVEPWQRLHLIRLALEEAENTKSIKNMVGVESKDEIESAENVENVGGMKNEKSRESIEGVESVEGVRGVRIDTQELERQGASYSIDTIRRIQGQHMHDELFFIMGGDVLKNFDQWREFEHILQLCHLIVVSRLPWQLPQSLIELPRGVRPYVKNFSSTEVQLKTNKNIFFIEFDKGIISSSQIREGILKGRDMRSTMPKKSADYIYKHKLYHPSSTTQSDTNCNDLLTPSTNVA